MCIAKRTREKTGRSSVSEDYKRNSETDSAQVKDNKQKTRSKENRTEDKTKPAHVAMHEAALSGRTE